MIFALDLTFIKKSKLEKEKNKIEDSNPLKKLSFQVLFKNLDKDILNVKPFEKNEEINNEIIFFTFKYLEK